MAKSLRQLAELAGVSYVTVLRALRGENNVRTETRDKILKLARQHRYEPNILTHGVTGRQTMTIAVILPGTMQPHLAADLAGAIDWLQQKNYCSLLLPSAAKVEQEYQQIRQAAMRRVDGMLLIPCLESAEADHFDEISKRDIPLVLMSKPMVQVPFDCFTGADESDALKLTQHLINLGHRRIIHLHGHLNNSPNELRRTNGWRKAMQQQGLFRPEDEIIGSQPQIGKMLLRSLKAAEHPTAIFAHNPSILAVIAEVSRETGLKIPQDISVATFLGGNNASLAICGLFRPGGIIDSSYQIGQCAAQRLTTLIKQDGSTKNKPQVKEIPGRIDHGDTIGPIN